MLLEAFGIAGKTCSDLMLLVVGDGNLRESYCALGQSRGLAGNVVFVGNVPDDRLPQHYAASDELVPPSKDMSEGFGLTLLEPTPPGNL